MLEDLPLPVLHERVLAMAMPPGNTVEQDDFYTLLITYRNTATADHLEQIATTCNRRVIRLGNRLPLDLLNAYNRLASLARWRARQIEEDFDARR